MESTDKYIGKLLDNRYEILEKIGTGGMAVVYKTKDHRLNRFVAVKILKDELALDADFRRRFHAESQAIAMLSHPNIVAVYDVSRTDNVEYIVMELIEGITLKQYINRKGVLGWKEALHFCTQIVKALSHAHSKGIIHRDIKPHNIMVLKDGSVKVADFGIAQLLSRQNNTLTQEALGSVHYISPEQAKGSHVDTRSDLYSLGVVMYEMLTNRLPFEGESAVSVAIQHISSIPLMPREINPDIPVGLEEITMHAMEPNLQRRYASADEMLYDLEEFRKNPDILFGYMGETAAAADTPADDATHIVPTSEVNEAVNKPAKPAKPKKPEMTTDEYVKSRRKSSRTAVLIGVVCVILFVIVAFLFMWRTLLKDMLDPEEERVTVPNFVGQNIDDVLDNEEYKEYYVFEVEYEINEEHESGYILFQRPSAERQMTVQTNGIPIKLTVSSGAEIKTMPDILNMDYRQAEILLQGYQLDLQIEKDAVYNDEVTSGYVIEQYPAEGAELTRGSSVFITYSKGPETIYVQVPILVGFSESQAIARLESYELAYSVEYVDDNAPKGQVIFQSYLAGEEVPLHTEIVIQVSNGPAETPTPTAPSASEPPAEQPQAETPEATPASE